MQQRTPLPLDVFPGNGLNFAGVDLARTLNHFLLLSKRRAC